MLEANPGLTPLEIKSILKSTAREDSKTGPIPSNGSVEWGSGKVNAYAAVMEASRLLSISDAPIFNNVSVYPTLAQNLLNIKAANYDEFEYKIFDMKGLVIESGRTTNRINIQSLPSGTFILHLESSQEFGVKKFIKM
jgi:hypothetical protein